MLTMLIAVTSTIGASVLAVLVVVVVAIRQEPRDTELSNIAPSRTAVSIRRLLGVYLRRPNPPADWGEGHDEYSPDTWPTAAWTNTTPPPPGRRR